jgi:hypothetical protein
MNVLFLILAICAGLTFLAGIFQGIVAVRELIKHAVRPKQARKWSAIILISIVLAIFFGYGAYATYSTQSAIIALPSPTPTSLAPSPTASQQVPPTSTLTAQPTLQPSETPTQPPVQATRLVTPLPITLGCDCSDPIVVTITKVLLDPAKITMLWYITFANNSPNFYYARFDHFTLEEGDQINYPTTGEPTFEATGQGTYVYDVSLPAGATKPVVLTFSFVPKNITYTLDSKLVQINNPFNKVLFQFN